MTAALDPVSIWSPLVVPTFTPRDLGNEPTVIEPVPARQVDRRTKPTPVR